MPRKAPDSNPEPTTRSSIKFVQLAGGADALYALDEQGRVFLYEDTGGWFQLEFDEERIDLENPEYGA